MCKNSRLAITHSTGASRNNERRRLPVCAFALLISALFVAACALPASPTVSEQPAPRATPLIDDAFPTPRLDGIVSERREVRFVAGDAELAGELDLPRGTGPHPLVVIIHHSGPVPRDAYGYLAEILVRAGYAVFRFDKRGTGASGGTYGCCESDDALAAYRAAVIQPGIDRCNVFIVAQSIGTQYLADQFEAYAAARPPRGVALLSSLLYADAILSIAAPVMVIVADSEANLEAIGPAAVAAHNARYGLDAALYVAEGAEHTLFDVRDGPMDWSDPAWVERYHRGAMAALLAQLDNWRAAPGVCAPE